MIIEAEGEPLSPIIDGERFAGIVRLVVRAGPHIRVAQVGPDVGPGGVTAGTEWCG